jgi:hypothetical protein
MKSVSLILAAGREGGRNEHLLIGCEVVGRNKIYPLDKYQPNLVHHMHRNTPRG